MATAFISSGNRFSYFYAISIGLATINVVLLIFAFRFKYRVEEHPEPGSLTATELTRLDEHAARPTPGVGDPAENSSSALKQTLTNKYMWLFSVFILL